MRTISEVEIRSIKGATEAAYTLGGGVTSFPELTRVNVSTLSKYASFNDDLRETVIPADVAVEADRRAKSPVITSAMARALGYRLIPDVSETDGQASGPITMDDAFRVMKEMTDVVQAIQSAHDDFHVDALERKKITKEIREAMRALEHALAKAEHGGSV